VEQDKNFEVEGPCCRLLWSFSPKLQPPA